MCFKILTLNNKSSCYIHSRQSIIKKRGNQATKGGRWMPRQGEAMKGVISCDKPGGAAYGL